jgi:hypothetical protein
MIADLVMEDSKEKALNQAAHKTAGFSTWMTPL